MPSPVRAGVCAGVILLAGLAGPALSGEPRTHDGFFLRLSAGGGYGETEIDVSGVPFLPGDNLKLSGATGDINFAIGGALKENFLLHGTIWGWAVSGPDVKSGGVTETVDANLIMSGVGIGFTYYVMPVNVYFSPSVGLANLSVERDNVTVSTDAGFGLDLTVGKEWWVGDGWGLGLAGGFSWHSVGDGTVDDVWSGPGVGLRFSATMN